MGENNQLFLYKLSTNREILHLKICILSTKVHKYYLKQQHGRKNEWMIVYLKYDFGVNTYGLT